MLLWKKNYNFDPTTIDTIVSQLRENEKSLDSDLNYHTSYFFNDEEKPELVFMNQYREICDQISKDMGLYHRAGLSFDVWMQVYTNQSKTFNRHEHFSGNEFLSWVHFLRQPEEQNFYFLNSEGEKIYPEVKQGDLIVFPSWVLHAAAPPKSEGDRVIISGNIQVEVLLRDRSNTEVSKLMYHRFGGRFGMWEVCQEKLPMEEYYEAES